MLEKRFKLEIVTPGRVMYEDEVESVRAPGVQGSFEVLIEHIPFLALLETGEVSLRKSDTRRFIATSGGVLEVLRTGVTLLLEAAEWAEDIDVDRAEQARARARQRLSERPPNLDVERAEAALKRASNRLRIAGQR